jgi:hypothetical protein
MAILKKIHYCWFGKNELPESAKKCILSWKKYFSDYEIVEWNESNYNINKTDFIKEAYAAKKYAFVSDYARFDILYNYGGIYFDTDVEVIKPFGDILRNSAFMGFETVGEVNSGLGMGSIAGNEIFQKILNYYNNRHFLKPDGSYDTRTVVSIASDIMTGYGLKRENRIQSIEGITIYPIEYLCPMSFETGKVEITNNTVSIHHFDGSWVSENGQKTTKGRWDFYKKYGEDEYIIGMYKRLKYLENNDVNKISIKNLYKIVIKRTLKKIIGRLYEHLKNYRGKKNST